MPPTPIEETLLALLSAVLLVILVLWMTGCASVDRGQAADGLTTIIALEQGFSEANPVFDGLNGPAILAVKIAVTQVVKLTPEPICQPGLLGLTVTGYGAALWNIGVMAGSGPAAIPLMIGLTVWQWENWEKDAVKVCHDPF